MRKIFYSRRFDVVFDSINGIAHIPSGTVLCDEPIARVVIHNAKIQGDILEKTIIRVVDVAGYGPNALRAWIWNHFSPQGQAKPLWDAAGLPKPHIPWIPIRQGLPEIPVGKNSSRSVLVMDEGEKVAVAWRLRDAPGDGWVSDFDFAEKGWGPISCWHEIPRLPDDDEEL